MTVIGITGPSGAGKGEVSKILMSYGINVIDADEVYNDVISPPSDCLDELVRNFGKRIINGVGFLNRVALADIVFGEENRDKLDLLNKITHKYVVARIRRLVSSFKAIGSGACAIDAPLLIEADLCSDCDIIISVLADNDIRVQRISVRDSIDNEAAKRRISSQRSDEFYIEHSDYTLYNNKDIFKLKEDLDKILTERKIVK